MARNRTPNSEMDETPKVHPDADDNLDLDDNFSLESILAEYKTPGKSVGKTSDERELARRADQLFQDLLRETGADKSAAADINGKAAAESLDSPEEDQKPVTEVGRPEQPAEDFPLQQKAERSADTAAEIQKPEKKRVEEPGSPDVFEELGLNQEKVFTDKDAADLLDRLLNEGKGESGESQDAEFSDKNRVYAKSPDNVTKVDFKNDERFDFQQGGPVYVDKDEPFEEEEKKEKPHGAFLSGLKSLFHLRQNNAGEDESGEEEEEDEVPPEPEEEEEEPEIEPDYLEESTICAKGLRSLTLRSNLALVLCILMGVVSWMYEMGKTLPLGMTGNLQLTSGVLALMSLAVMALGVDVLVDGFTDFIRADPGVETLALFSALASIADVIFLLISGTSDRGLPFCLVSSVAIHVSMRSRLRYRLALRDAYRVPAAVASPETVISQDVCDDGRSILRRATKRLDGYSRMLTGQDLTEKVYTFAAPIFLIAAAAFAGVTTIGTGKDSYFLFVFSALLAVSASFSAFSAYDYPFYLVTKLLRRIGIAVAGWCGAVEMDASDGTLVMDNDVFPPGTTAVSGIKLFDNTTLRSAVVYTSSMILASGSSLSKAFSDLMASQGMHLQRVDDFACYEGGGLSALISGERVYVGSAGFMNLMGIRVPEKVDGKNSVLMAINGELASVISINYIPSNSVQKALVSLLRSGINMLFAMRDFNITPLMLQQKFKVSLDDIEYIPAEKSFAISDDNLPKATDAAAVLCREGLGQMADAITGSRRLVASCRLNTILAVFSSAVGFLFLLVLCGRFAYSSMRVTSVFIFNISIYILTWLVSHFVNRRR